jgi:TetR/AcrR family transcriptional repressor of nem operon
MTIVMIAINGERHISCQARIPRQKVRVMRVSREKAAENRQRILAAAARLFRETGFDGAGVDAIMQAAGLTHGGFYGHFRSKEDLAAEAVRQGLAAGAERMAGACSLRAYADAYLSAAHCADRGGGCMVAALGAEMARQGGGVRRGLTAHVRAAVGRLASMFGAGDAPARRVQAIAAFAGMVGALTLARAVDDPALADEILAAGRAAFGGATLSPPAARA